jgi:hypothetical protein
MLIINDFYDFTYTIMMHKKYKGNTAYFMHLWHSLLPQLWATRGLYEANENIRVENTMPS